MHVIDAVFRRLTDCSVPDLLGELGVYVLWDGMAKRRPTYIGEGNIIKRLVEHHGRFAQPLDGYVAVLSTRGVSHQRAKANGMIVEALLLEVAEDTDRRPSVNVAPGRLRSLDDILRRHPTVRINVSGLDPLRAPESLPRLASAKRIVLRASSGGDIDVDHDWRLRRQG